MKPLTNLPFAKQCTQWWVTSAVKSLTSIGTKRALPCRLSVAMETALLKFLCCSGNPFLFPPITTAGVFCCQDNGLYYDLNANRAVLYPSLLLAPSAARHPKALSKWCFNEMLINTQIRWSGARVAVGMKEEFSCVSWKGRNGIYELREAWSGVSSTKEPQLYVRPQAFSPSQVYTLANK